MRDRSIELLDEVGIPDAARRLASLPHQFSGGMLQRVMIAHALAAGPELLIADEPTTALDVTVQAQVVELLLRLRAARGLAILFISHDLALVSQVADRILVMYGGLVMEQGPGGDGAGRTAPSLHARAAGGPPGAGRALHGPAAHNHPRHRARSAAPGARLPVRAALSVGRRDVQPRRAAPCHPRRLPSPRHRRRHPPRRPSPVPATGEPFPVRKPSLAGDPAHPSVLPQIRRLPTYHKANPRYRRLAHHLLRSSHPLPPPPHRALLTPSLPLSHTHRTAPQPQSYSDRLSTLPLALTLSPERPSIPKLELPPSPDYLLPPSPRVLPTYTHSPSSRVYSH